MSSSRVPIPGRVRHGVALALLASLSAAASPALAQGDPNLMGQGSGPQPLVPRRQTVPQTLPPVAPRIEIPGIEAILAKLRAGETLTQAEFMVYLRAVEAHAPNRTAIAAAQAATAREDLPAQAWALVSTKLHDSQYGPGGPAHDDRNTVVMGISLFRNGSENQDWEKIDIFHSRGPKYITDAAGEKVDIAHAYAGIAALVMRDGEIAGTLMGNVNTGWGDSLQVWAGRIEGAQTVIGGIFTLNGDRIDRGSDRWSTAPNYKPPDQVRGNKIGNEARDYLQDHRTASLSRAFEHAFTETSR